MSLKPRFWYLWPLGLLLFVAFGLTVALVGVIVHDTWSTTGVLFLEPVPSQNLQYLGYVRGEANSPRATMISDGVAFHSYDDEHLSYEFTFVPPFSLIDHQLVTARSVSFDTQVGRYYTLSIVYPVGTVAENSFSFIPIDGSENTVIYNFDKIVIPAGWKSIEVFKGNEVSIFVDGSWGYRVYGDKVITVTMDREDYPTKSGFGGVCTRYNTTTKRFARNCPMILQDFTRSYGDFSLYYPESSESKIIITSK